MRKKIHFTFEELSRFGATQLDIVPMIVQRINAAINDLNGENERVVCIGAQEPKGRGIMVTILSAPDADYETRRRLEYNPEDEHELRKRFKDLKF